MKLLKDLVDTYYTPAPKPIKISVNYKWLITQIIEKAKGDDIDDALQVLKDLWEEQEKELKD